MDYDLVVIGGGAGGMGAARTGVRKKKRTLLVQDGEIGGDCTFTGCVPSKALIAAAARGRTFTEAMASARRAIERIASTEDANVFRREGIDVREGRARFLSPNEIEVDGTRIGADRFVVATGATPATPDIDGLRSIDHLTSDTVWALDDRPASLAILGGGAIGCELAQAFGRLGTAVTILQSGDRLLPKEEPEVSAALAEVFRREGIDVRTGSRVTRVEALDGHGRARAHLADGSAVEADRVLVAIGRRPVTEGLDPEAAGIELDERGFVRTDDYLRTSAPNVWAVGDVAGKLQFTHAADEMSRIAVGNAFSGFRQRRFRAERTPWVTFTSPEVGRVGITEAEAVERGGVVAFLPMTEVDRAIAADETDGFLKVIAGPRWLAGNLAGGRILGATVMGSTGGELIHEFALAMRTGMFPARIAMTTHAYPTWAMAVQKVVGQLFYEIEGRQAGPAHRRRPAFVTLFDEAPERPSVRRLTLVRLSSEVARALGTIGKVAVEGEVHRPSTRPGGRIYFTLKDRAAQIDVTVPAGRARRARVVDGERVQVTGSLEWNNSWGRLQFVADEVVPVGAGAVAAMIAESRQRLRADGLLDRPRLRIPRLPESIGVICGSEAAVRADIESVVAARFPGYPMVFREVTVSGPGAVDAIVEAIADLDGRPDVDVIILARGGGDATQLLPFSDEDLCRAVCASTTPVVAAIGHEGDRPLCDEVADLRCGTPSLAASAVVPDRDALVAGLEASWTRAEAAATRRLAEATHHLATIDRDRAVTAGVERARERLARAVGRLELVHPKRRLAQADASLSASAGRLAVAHPQTRVGVAAVRLAAANREREALSPARVLERGYAIVRGAGGTVLRAAEDADAGDALTVQLAAGRLTVTVDGVGP